MAERSKYNVVIPVGMKPRPKIHEETAAEIFANHFKSDVYFIETGGQGTPDVSTKGVEWDRRARSAAARTISEKTCVKPARSQ